MDQTLDTKGAHHALLQEITTEDPDVFHIFLRMDKADLYELLTKVTPLIQFVFFHQHVLADEIYLFLLKPHNLKTYWLICHVLTCRIEHVLFLMSDTHVSKVLT